MGVAKTEYNRRALGRIKFILKSIVRCCCQSTIYRVYHELRYILGVEVVQVILNKKYSIHICCILLYLAKNGHLNVVCELCCRNGLMEG